MLRRTLIPVLFCVMQNVVSADDPDYRLAGIVAVGESRFLAVIEMPDGRQGLFRAGDTLGSARIRDISRSEVRMEVNGREVALSLRGNPKLSAATPVEDLGDGEDVEMTPDEPSGTAEVRDQPLFYSDTLRLLTSVARMGNAATPTDKPAPAAGAQPAAAASADALSAKLGEVLGVPEGANIVAVDGHPVTSPQDVIYKIVPLLNLGRAVRLNLSGGGDVHVLYITPVEDQ
jgi:hypothetical protein